MAFRKPTYADLWHTVDSVIHTKPGQLRRSYHSYHHKYRYKNKYNHHHSYYYNHFPDNHQLTIMDFCKYIHDSGGPINVYPMGDDNVEYGLNDNTHENSSNDLSSVTVTLTNKRTPKEAGSIFYRHSNGYHGSKGVDSLNSFIVMFHNTMIENGSKGEKINLNTLNQAEFQHARQQANQLRMKFIKGYYKKYGTYHSQWNYDTKDDFNGSYDGNYVAHGESSSVSVRHDNKFHDNNYEFRDKSGKNAYRYLCKSRGIDKNLVSFLLKNDLVRSFNVHKKSHKCNDKKTLKKLENEDYYDYRAYLYKELGLYNPKFKNNNEKSNFIKSDKGKQLLKKHKIFIKKLNNYQPAKHYSKKWGRYYIPGEKYNAMIEFNWKMPTSYEVANAPYDARNPKNYKIVGKDRIYLTDDGYHTDRTKFSRGKQIARSSRHGFGFNFEVGNGKNNLFVFEDPIDAISCFNQYFNLLKDTNSTFLSLGGCGKIRNINQFIKTQFITLNKSPENLNGDFKHLIMCFDNDHGGYDNIEKLMSGCHYKASYAGNINPITKDKQMVVVLVPGVEKDAFGQFEKNCPKEFKGSWKDFNDVLSNVENNNNLRANEILLPSIEKHPAQKMNIDQYSQYITSRIMKFASESSPMNAYMISDFFKSYYNMDKYLNNKSLYNLNNSNRYIKEICSYYKDMDSKGKLCTEYFMNKCGGRYLSPLDLYRYSKKFLKFNNSKLSVVINHNQKAEMLVTNTINSLSGKHSRDAFVLIIHSMIPIMAYRHLKGNRKYIPFKLNSDRKIGMISVKGIMKSLSKQVPKETNLISKSMRALDRKDSQHHLDYHELHKYAQYLDTKFYNGKPSFSNYLSSGDIKQVNAIVQSEKKQIQRQKILNRISKANQSFYSNNYHSNVNQKKHNVVANHHNEQNALSAKDIHYQYNNQNQRKIKKHISR